MILRGILGYTIFLFCFVLFCSVLKGIGVPLYSLADPVIKGNEEPYVFGLSSRFSA